MITECPHCHRRVLPSREGFCPSCEGDIHDTRGAVLGTICFIETPSEGVVT